VRRISLALTTRNSCFTRCFLSSSDTSALALFSGHGEKKKDAKTFPIQFGGRVFTNQVGIL
jgi:hypothetical protein